MKLVNWEFFFENPKLRVRELPMGDVTRLEAEITVEDGSTGMAISECDVLESHEEDFDNKNSFFSDQADFHDMVTEFSEKNLLR